MRVYTVFAVCDDDFPCTQGRELQGDLVVVNHDTQDAEVVVGIMKSQPADLEALADCCHEAIGLLCQLKQHGESGKDER